MKNTFNRLVICLGTYQATISRIESTEVNFHMGSYRINKDNTGKNVANYLFGVTLLDTKIIIDQGYK